MSSAVLPFPQLNSTSFLVTLSQTASRAASIAYKPLDLVSDLVARGLFRVLDVAIPEGREVVLNAAGGGGPMETEMAAAAAVAAGAAARESVRAAEVAALNALPGPWTFATSSFALSLLAMAVLVNRIHHLVPPRRPTSLHLSPLLRLSIRLPSLLLLLRAIFLLTAVLGTHHGYSFGRITGVGVGAVKLLGWGTAWAGKSTLVGLLDKWEVVDGKIMWEVFVGTAAAVVTETFVRALDDDIGSQTHFVRSSRPLASQADLPFLAEPPLLLLPPPHPLDSLSHSISYHPDPALHPPPRRPLRALHPPPLLLLHSSPPLPPLPHHRYLQLPRPSVRGARDRHGMGQDRSRRCRGSLGGDGVAQSGAGDGV